MREHFNQSYIRLSHCDSIFSKPNCFVVKLYFLIPYSAQLAIPIFKINIAISTFGNFFRDVQLKWFYFKHRSLTTESVLMAVIFWQTEQNQFELFFLVEKFQTFCLCRILTIFSNSIKIYKLFTTYEVWYGIDIRLQIFVCYLHTFQRVLCRGCRNCTVQKNHVFFGTF